MEAFEFPLTKQDVEWLSSLLRLPETGELRIRKEYRVLTDEERRDFHQALNILKNDTSVSLNKYDLLANIHSRSSANKAAHAGPGFLGWHRVFLLMVENALRQACPNVTIPYWDVTLDQRMDKPYQSVIWSGDFLGTGHGPVFDGPFKHWETPFDFGHLERLVSAQGRLLSDADIKRIMSQKRLGEISYFSASSNTNLEALHNRVHVWVGGQMRKIEIGAFDPIFYLLHSFVDKIWEDFRLHQRTEGVDPQKDFPEFYGRAGHAPLAPMGLGSLGVLDGLSDVWGHGVQYRPRPTCKATTTNSICDSPYLKCNSKYFCVSISKTDTMVSISTSIQEKVESENMSNRITMNQENLSGGNNSSTSGTRIFNNSRIIDEHEPETVKDVNSGNTSQGTINITARDYHRYILQFNMYTDKFHSLSHPLPHNYQYPSLEIFDL
ncbi:putative tyrosinase-like protein tyr-3 isoform X2 [Mizuhopecten yessoensis]|nr:putative tyrosinase-like protein tyr-3 isoform X2 [Mizuhopecten yessoensis]XP_021358023.1 putative tyrosinase-like protein tyr-3 isoform X2 [Mizuhopecten yessoensis]XP_021358024.1 putative tyrosinase-like protein tyr-3 isoform X2 [Mizuhopecten yessoensis]